MTEEPEAEEAPEEEGEAEPHAHHESVAEAARHRLRSLWRAERPLKLITGLALAQLIAGAIVVTTRNLPVPLIQVDSSGGHPIWISQLILDFCLTLLVFAWGYLLSGALHAHPWLRGLGLVAFTLAMAPLLGLAPGPRAIVLVIWGLGLYTWLHDWRRARRGEPHHAHHRRLRFDTFWVVVALVGAVYGSAWAGAGLVAPRAFTTALAIQLQALVLLVVPLLFLAGTDFAEWGQASSEQLVAAMAGRAPRWAVTLLVLVASLLALADSARQLGTDLVPQMLLAGAIGLGVAGLAWASGLHGRRRSLELPFLALLLASAAYFVILVAGAAVSFLVEGEATAGSREPARPLLVVTLAGWGLVLAATTGLLVALRRRERPRLRAGILFVGVVALFLGLTAAGFLAGTPGLAGIRLNGIRALGGIAGVAVAAWSLLASRGQRLEKVEKGLVELLVLNLTLAVLGWVFALYDLAGSVSSQLTIAQVAITLLILAWDVTMTGGSVTQVQGRWFPRHTRYLLYFGYVMLVSAMVLYFASLKAAPGDRIEGGFESDFWPQHGLLGLGVPMLATLLVLKTANLLATTSGAGEGAEEEAMAEPEDGAVTP